MDNGLIRTGVIRALFYPTLAWNAVNVRLVPGRRWWNRVDDHLVLGALPLPWMVPALKEAGVTSVINTCVEYPGPLAAYKKHGIEQLHLPTLDFSPPTLDHIRRGVDFITERAEAGHSVYVHCKAGRGRSATVALCWLMSFRGMPPEEALRHLQSHRPHVNPHLCGRQVVRDFHQLCPPGAREDHKARVEPAK